jgi:hypothetical protein
MGGAWLIGASFFVHPAARTAATAATDIRLIGRIVSSL